MVSEHQEAAQRSNGDDSVGGKPIKMGNTEENRRKAEARFRAMKAELNEHQLVRLKEMPATNRRTYAKACLGHSRPAAIKAFCEECVCWVREEVRLCTAKACPLYPYRPYK